MQFFDPDYQTKLSKTVAEFEQQTSAELVVTVAKRSHDYANGAWTAAAVATLIVFSLFMLLEYEFFDNHIYLGTIITFCAVFGLVYAIPPFKKLLSTAAARQHFCQTAAYALFAEQGVYKTKSRTGVLVYVSLLEKSVVIVADKAIMDAFGEKGLANIRQEFLSIFNQDPAAALLTTIGKVAPIFAQALPLQANDEDELSNTIPHFIHGGFGAKTFRVKKS